MIAGSLELVNLALQSDIKRQIFRVSDKSFQYHLNSSTELVECRSSIVIYYIENIFYIHMIVLPEECYRMCAYNTLKLACICRTNMIGLY